MNLILLVIFFAGMLAIAIWGIVVKTCNHDIKFNKDKSANSLSTNYYTCTKCGFEKTCNKNRGYIAD